MARDNVPEDVFIFAVARLLECPVYLLEATVLTDVETLLKGLGFVGREWDLAPGARATGAWAISHVSCSCYHPCSYS